MTVLNQIRQIYPQWIARLPQRPSYAINNNLLKICGHLHCISGSEVQVIEEHDYDVVFGAFDVQLIPRATARNRHVQMKGSLPLLRVSPVKFYFLDVRVEHVEPAFRGKGGEDEANLGSAHLLWGESDSPPLLRTRFVEAVNRIRLRWVGKRSVDVTDQPERSSVGIIYTQEAVKSQRVCVEPHYQRNEPYIKPVIYAAK